MRRPNSVAGSEATFRGAVIVVVLIILPLAVRVAGLTAHTSLLIVVSKGTLRFAALISLVTAVVLSCSLLANPRHKPDRQLN